MGVRTEPACRSLPANRTGTAYGPGYAQTGLNHSHSIVPGGLLVTS
jgi:hypothetical protein